MSRWETFLVERQSGGEAATRGTCRREKHSRKSGRSKDQEERSVPLQQLRLVSLRIHQAVEHCQENNF